jgi:hypothetical protein
MSEVQIRRLADQLRDRVLSRFVTSHIPSGKVIFMDDFKSATLKWTTVINGAGTVTRDTSDVFDGPASLKITTGDQATNYTEAARFVGRDFYKLSPLGLEFWVNPKSISVGSDIQCGFEWYDGSQAHSAYLRYLNDAVTPAWYVREIPTWRQFATSPRMPQGKNMHYHHVKFVADLVKEKYCWALIDDVLFDLSGWTTHRWSTGVSYSLEFFVWNRNNGFASAQSCWWANIVVTCLEPAQLGAF